MSCQTAPGCRVREIDLVMFMLEDKQHESSMSTAPEGPYSHEPTVVQLRDRGALNLVNVTLRSVGPNRGSCTYQSPAQHARQHDSNNDRCNYGVPHFGYYFQGSHQPGMTSKKSKCHIRGGGRFPRRLSISTNSSCCPSSLPAAHTTL